MYKKKVKALLLGTVHFSNPNLDEFNPGMDNILSEKRQKELELLVSKLRLLNPTKVFVEIEPKDQNLLNEKYQAYLKNQYKMEKSEVYQIGFRLAKQQNIPKVIAVNNKSSEIELEELEKFAERNNQGNIIDQIRNHNEALRDKINDVIKHKSIIEMLEILNSSQLLTANNFSYIDHLIRVGIHSEYIGAEMVANWFKRNLLIYTNILREIDSDDDCIFVIFGHGHIPFLKFLFQGNSRFKLINTQKFLQSKV